MSSVDTARRTAKLDASNALKQAEVTASSSPPYSAGYSCANAVRHFAAATRTFITRSVSSGRTHLEMSLCSAVPAADPRPVTIDASVSRISVRPTD